LPEGLSAEFAGCEALRASRQADGIRSVVAGSETTGYNATDEERAVCVCLNQFDVIAVALARHLFIGALLILGDVPEVRGDITELSYGGKAFRSD